MYNDIPTWIFPFQSYVMLTMIQNHIKSIDENIKIMERSIFSTQYCFIELHRRLNNIDSIKYEIFKQWFEFIIKNSRIEIDLIIYLRTTPDVLINRIQQRNRLEDQNIELSYLEYLQEVHDDWLIEKKFPVPANVIVLNGNESTNNILLELENKLIPLGWENE